MKKKRGPTLFLVEVFRNIAPKMGATVLVEPEWGITGQIRFKNGRNRYFRGSTIDLNPMGASDIAKDKDFANFYMKGMGYPTVEGKTFFSKDVCEIMNSPRNIGAAYRYATKIGLPVIVKPNSGSKGIGVAKVYNKRDLYRAMKFIFQRDTVALVQKPVLGKDYRIVVLDDKVISAYLRIALNVIGNGKSNVSQLLKKKQGQYVKDGRDTIIKLKDPRILDNLKRQRLTMQSVIPKDEKVFLLDNANLSSGGDAIDVTKVIHPEFKKIAIQLTKDMGLRLCGVDVMVQGDISEKPRTYWVLEINSAPGLDHYASTGKDQKKIVEDMYTRVLKAMQ